MKFLWKVEHLQAVCFHILFISDPQIERHHLLGKAKMLPVYYFHFLLTSALTPSPLTLYLAEGRIQRNVSDSLCTQ